MNKKIVFLLSDINEGGAQKVIIALANYIAEHQSDYDVFLITIIHKGVYSHLLSPKVTRISILDNENKRLNKFRAIPQVIREFQKINPDTVISSLNIANIINAVCSFFVSYQVIMREGNTPSQFFKHAGIKKRIIAFLTQMAIKKSDYYICPSIGVGDDVIRYYKTSAEKVRVIENPLNFEEIEDLARRPLSLPTEIKGEFILAVGRLIHAKGFDVLILAMNEVLKEKKIDLIILGSGELKEKLIKQAKELGIQKHIHFLGFVKNPYPFYLKTKLFVLSSRWEGSPNVLLHALSLEVPIVSTRCPSGPSEVIKNQNLLVEVDNHLKLAQAILRQLNSTEREDANSIKKKHSIEIVVSKWMDIIGKRRSA